MYLYSNGHSPCIAKVGEYNAASFLCPFVAQNNKGFFLTGSCDMQNWFSSFIGFCDEYDLVIEADTRAFHEQRFRTYTT